MSDWLDRWRWPWQKLTVWNTVWAILTLCSVVYLVWALVVLFR